jgi:hypothetical protein
MTPGEERKLLIAIEKLDGIPGKVSELEGHVIRIETEKRGLERRVELLEDTTENTDSIYLDDLKHKLHTYETSQAHWIRYVVAAIVALVLMGISTYLGYVLRKG